jgi:hypothetical protein
MKKSLFVSILMLLIGGFFASSVVADDTLVRFRGGIGDLPVSNVAGIVNPDGTFPDVTRNIVRGVEPAGQIWVISALTADVKVDGRSTSTAAACCWAEATALARTPTPESSRRSFVKPRPPFPSTARMAPALPSRQMATSRSRMCWSRHHRPTATAPCSLFAIRSPTQAGSPQAFRSLISPDRD